MANEEILAANRNYYTCAINTYDSISSHIPKALNLLLLITFLHDILI